MQEWAGRLIKGVLERKSYKILVCGFGFIAGIIIHSFLDIKINFFWLYNLLLVLAVATVLFWNNKKRLSIDRPPEGCYLFQYEILNSCAALNVAPCKSFYQLCKVRPYLPGIK